MWKPLPDGASRSDFPGKKPPLEQSLGERRITYPNRVVRRIPDRKVAEVGVNHPSKVDAADDPFGHEALP